MGIKIQPAVLYADIYALVLSRGSIIHFSNSYIITNLILIYKYNKRRMINHFLYPYRNPCVSAMTATRNLSKHTPKYSLTLGDGFHYSHTKLQPPSNISLHLSAGPGGISLLAVAPRWRTRLACDGHELKSAKIASTPQFCVKPLVSAVTEHEDSLVEAEGSLVLKR